MFALSAQFRALNGKYVQNEQAINDESNIKANQHIPEYFDV